MQYLLAVLDIHFLNCHINTPKQFPTTSTALNFADECSDYVDCDRGFVRGYYGNTTKTCLEECGGYPNNNCCSGDSSNGALSHDACLFATAKICKDGSCSGYAGACLQVGLSVWGGNGFVRGIVNSCKGERACVNAGSGYGSTYTGSVGVIKNSCNAEKACNGVGTGYFDTGSVGDIIESCNQERACHDVGYNNPLGDLTTCCNCEANECHAGNPYFNR